MDFPDLHHIFNRLTTDWSALQATAERYDQQVAPVDRQATLTQWSEICGQIAEAIEGLAEAWVAGQAAFIFAVDPKPLAADGVYNWLAAAQVHLDEWDQSPGLVEGLLTLRSAIALLRGEVQTLEHAQSQLATQPAAWQHYLRLRTLHWASRRDTAGKLRHIADLPLAARWQARPLLSPLDWQSDDADTLRAAYSASKKEVP